MASYLDQVPKQLSARRKAFRAAKENPALLPSCWAIVRSIGNNIYEYMRNSVIGGCTFPDRPIYLSPEDAAFLNFGTTPKLLLQDAAWIAAENAKQPPPAPDAPPSPEIAKSVARKLAQIVSVWGKDQNATRVYNLEAWLQDMYRDKLDVDFAEDLQRQIDALNTYMDSVPKSIAATGLNAKLSKGVVDAFNLFKTITGSSHQLDREKMSFVDRRSYVNTIQKIELIMAKADESLGAAVAGRSVVREQFNLWKDANYEMMALTRQLRVLWAGTSLDDRIQELSNLLFAVQKAINRCTEESRAPMPQLPMCRADQENFSPPPRGEIADTFRATTLFDMIAGENSAIQVREVRKFGPLSVVVAPGAGEPRYCWEVRKLSAGDDDDDRDRRRPKDTSTAEREIDVDRRVRYPLNCIVVPLAAAGETFRQDMADAWLEYNQWAFPMQFKEYMELAKTAAPAAFAPPEDKEAKDLPPTYARRSLGSLTAAFVDWAHTGAEPDAEAVKEFAPFREMALSRLNPAQYLIPNQYRPLVRLFSEAGAKRRLEMWKRCLGVRFALDRQLVAVCVLMKDWKALRNWIKFLPSALKENSALQNGFAKAADTADQFGSHKAEGFFRKFLTDQPDLKSALVSIESQVSIEVETLRTQSESLGRVFQYDQASETMMRRQFSQIQEKRLAANAHIDHYLTGLMYAHDNNLDAAEATLVMCLSPDAGAEGEEGAAGASPESAQDAPVPAPEEIGQKWFDDNLKPLEGKFSRRFVAGKDAPGTVCHEYPYFNLGLVYLKQKRYTEAAFAFSAAVEKAPAGQSHLHNLWAERHKEDALKNIESRPAPEPAALTTTRVTPQAAAQAGIEK